MQVVHTAAVPPNQGRISRAMSGCTRNSKNEDRKIVAACIIRRSDSLGEPGGETGVSGWRERKQALPVGGRNRQRAHEGRESLAVDALAARQRLQLFVGAGD